MDTPEHCKGCPREVVVAEHLSVRIASLTEERDRLADALRDLYRAVCVAEDGTDTVQPYFSVFRRHAAVLHSLEARAALAGEEVDG